MARVLLTIETDATSVRRAFGEIREDSRALSSAIRGDFQRLSEVLAEPFRKMRREVAGAMAAIRREEERATKAAEGGAQRRTAIAQGEALYRKSSAQETAREHEQAEERATAATTRESRRRVNQAEHEARRLIAETKRANEERARRVGAIAGTAGQTALSVAGSAHEMIQSARQTAAQRETALNSTLIQLVPGGATADEIAQTRATIMERIRRDRLNPETAIAAIGQAQSFANALGGDNAQQRRENVSATMDDVRFASNIDPSNISGLVRVGALTRGKMNAGDRQSLLRAFAGISFQGSVETDTMITQGLRGLQEAWSSGTANITDPNEASRRRLEIARDFAAQVQAAAASGVTTNVAANRTNTIRNALANDYRQDRLGAAFAARRSTMTTEQRAAFDAAFTRGEDGKYRMNESVRGRASDAARFFGTMFNNDAGAMRNFLGTHGGGGARQLMLTPDVNELSTYFAQTTNARGQQVRMYDYVNELQRSMITPDQERTIEQVRNAEDSRRLQDEENSRVAALTGNTTELTKLSNQLAQFRAQNPLTSTALPAAGGLLATALGGTKAVAGSLGLAYAGSQVTLGTGRMFGVGPQISEREGALRRALSMVPGVSSIAGVLGGAADLGRAATDTRTIEALIALPDKIAQAVSRAPLTVDPHAAVHADTTRSTRSQASP